MTYEKTCPICGKTFTTNRKAVKCCSSECQHQVNLKRYKTWHQEHREEHNRINNEYGKAHRAEQREAYKRFHEKHPGKQKEYLKTYYTKKANEMGVTISEYYKIISNKNFEKKAAAAGVSVETYKKLYNKVKGKNRHQQVLSLLATEVDTTKKSPSIGSSLKETFTKLFAWN